MIGSALQRVIHAVLPWLQGWLQAWDRFWFTPRYANTLAFIRIATGAMLTYTHLVLASDLMSFLGDKAWVDIATSRSLHDGSYGPPEAVWTYLWSLESATALWVHQFVAIGLAVCMTVGFATRVTVPLTWFIQLMFVHRLTGALYGLDQITTMLAMYLMLTPCGSVYSCDAWWRRRSLSRDRAESRWFSFWFPADCPSVLANIGTRLAQLHLCTIYLFGGLWKARGQLWWDGTAMWFAAASYEYQSVDMTWIANYPILFAALTHLTVFWETFYCALVWPRSTRPVVLFIAVLVHGGIALHLGMITFGTMMIVANGIFLEPEWFRGQPKRLSNGSPDSSKL